jgi:hypothetical protein
MDHRQEIHKLIDQMPAATLPELHAYLQKLAEANEADATLALRLRQILEEDSNLLHRLAQ